MTLAMADKPDTKSLLEQARAGDRAAFERVASECKDRLEGFVKARLGSHLRSVVEVEDVIQETYAQAIASISRFEWRGEGSFLRWLNRIAEHAILNLAKKQRARGGAVLFVEREMPGRDPAPSKAMRREERRDRLQRALSELKPDYREAIELVRIQGLQVKEAAARMNRTPKAVMHLLARGLKELKTAFGDTESLGLPPEELQERDGRNDA